MTYVSPIIAIGLITIHMTIVLWCRQPLCIITPQLERAKNKKQKVKISFSNKETDSKQHIEPKIKRQ